MKEPSVLYPRNLENSEKSAGKISKIFDVSIEECFYLSSIRYIYRKMLQKKLVEYKLLKSRKEFSDFLDWDSENFFSILEKDNSYYNCTWKEKCRYVP